MGAVNSSQKSSTPHPELPGDSYQVPQTVRQYQFGRVDGAGDLAVELLDALKRREKVATLKEILMKHVLLHQYVTKTGTLPL